MLMTLILFVFLFDFDLIISCFVKFHFQVYSLFVIHNRIVLNKERSIFILGTRNSVVSYSINCNSKLNVMTTNKKMLNLLTRFLTQLWLLRFNFLVSWGGGGGGGGDGIPYTSPWIYRFSEFNRAFAIGLVR